MRAAGRRCGAASQAAPCQAAPRQAAPRQAAAQNHVAAARWDGAAGQARRFAMGALAAAGVATGGLLVSATAQDRLSQAPEPLAVIDALYPEGPVVIDGDLYVAEMTADRIRRFERRPASAGAVRIDGAPVWGEPRCGPTALAEIAEQRIAVLCHLGGYVAVVLRTAAGWRTLRRLEMSDDGVRLDSANDISADGRGGAYFSNAGRFGPRMPAEGRVIHLAADLSTRVVADGFAYANGVAVSADGAALLVSEHLAQRVWRFDIGADGRLGDRTMVLDRAGLGLLGPEHGPLVGPDGIEPLSGGDALIAIYGAGRAMAAPLSGAPPFAARTHVAAPFAFTTNVAIWGDWLVVVGAYDNRVRPYRGGVAIYPAAPAAFEAGN